MARIVVGIDGSEGAQRALAWALDEAARRQASLEVVTACHFPDAVGVPGARFPVEATADVEERTRKEQGRLIAEVIGEPAGVDLQTTVRCAHAADLLVERSNDADLLVVGSRGLGGFRGLLLGSVAHQVVSHAQCPVVVVPPPNDEPRSNH